MITTETAHTFKPKQKQLRRNLDGKEAQKKSLLMDLAASTLVGMVCAPVGVAVAAGVAAGLVAAAVGAVRGRAGERPRERPREKTEQQFHVAEAVDHEITFSKVSAFGNKLICSCFLCFLKKIK